MSLRPHLFVLRGDIRRVVADAWLVPADRGLNLSRSFRGTADVALAQLPDDWGHDGTRVARVGGGTTHCWVGNVGRYRAEPAWYAEAGRQFIRRAAADLAGQAPATGRPLPLLAMPLVGTGFGGGARISGEVTREVVSVAAEEAADAGVDVALVCWEAAPHAAVQRARADLARTSPAGAAGWSDLSDRQRASARSLGERAREGDLVLFLGAGVSRGAGLPTWDELLADLARLAGIDAVQQEGLARLPALDRARIVEGRLRAAGHLLDETVSARLRHDRYPLVQGLAASLPVGEVVTMNYDQLFEMASAGAGREAAVLPWEPARSRDRWLLKMHGCVARGDIVLTRDHYHRYEHTRAALAGIVQALLITRHMLFLGFSLSDPNFHRIVDDVRQAVRRGDEVGEEFGTAVVLRDDPLMEELWTGEIALEPMSEAGSDPAGDHAARLAELFLDRMSAVATDDTAHLLDPSYRGILTDEERWLSDALSDLGRPPPPGVESTPAWSAVQRLLRDLGA